MTFEKMACITYNALIGQAVGDAFGVPVEFMGREEVRKANLNQMEGCDTNLINPLGRWSESIPAGTWSDDTSMTVAAMAAITENNGEIDHDKIMKNFFDWWWRGDYTPMKHAFGLGGTCSEALYNWAIGAKAVYAGPERIDTNGNGSVMRILPFSLYCIFKRLTLDSTVAVINNGSRLTHGHEISMMGCLIYTLFLWALITFKGNVKKAWNKARKVGYSKYYGEEAVGAYAWLLSDEFLGADDTQINSTGYVVDTLEAVAFSLIHSRDYESTIMTAINLGGDTDTYGAIAGSLAGVVYGIDKIPMRWLERLAEADMLGRMAASFARAFEKK